jgi:hypothetical protein
MSSWVCVTGVTGLKVSTMDNAYSVARAAVRPVALSAWLAALAGLAGPSATQAQTVTPPAAQPEVATQSGWTAAEIQIEQARCTHVLKGLDVVYKPASPMRENACGAPAPVELISIGKAPQVSFYPTVTLTCDMVAALHRWITRDLQGLARKHLGSELVRIDTMSSYSCRTAYGRKNARLSEHGKANALDIRAFMTATGSTSEVLADWGPTGHEIAAQVAAARKLEGERAMAAAAAASKAAAAARGPQLPGSVAGGPVLSGVATGSLPGGAGSQADASRPTLAIGPREMPPTGLSLPLPMDTSLGLSTSMGKPARLGGPKAAGGVDAGGSTDFLRAAHSSACRIFGTVLGPEANAAHRNHFHVDMAERKLKSICE